jgi:membrane protein insertase Oxa1/YidC/SpoIIIJ
MIVSLNQMKNVARLALIKDDVEAITKQWKALGGYSAPPRANDTYQKALKDLFQKNNCNPLTSIIGIVVQVFCS